MHGWTRPELLSVVGRGPARERCLEVVGWVLDAADACREGSLAEQVRDRPFGFTAEGLGLARGVALRSVDCDLRGHERVFFHVGLGMARAFGAELEWPQGPLRRLQADGLGFASALQRPGRALRLTPPADADPVWFVHGLGRACWFLSAGSPSSLPEILAEARPGLIEGFGLASVFTGGVPGEVEQRLLRRVGPARAELELGRCFARWLRGSEPAAPRGLYEAIGAEAA